MFDFLNLVKNENMKIYRRPRTYVMAGVMVALVLFVSLITLAIGGRGMSMWLVSAGESRYMSGLITIFVVIVGASSVAEEFSGGTIKLLLIRPWSRSKILLSKYISVLMFAFLMTVLMLASVLLINWLCFDLGHTSATSAETIVTGQLTENQFIYQLKFYGLKFIEVIMTLTIAFMLSVLFRSSALAIGIALVQILIVNDAVGLIGWFQKKWIDYVLFVHLNLTDHLVYGKIPSRPELTLNFSLLVLGVYFAIFMALTWYIFNKRDVAN